MSPHGVFQVPKSAASLSDAVAERVEQLLGGRARRDVVVDATCLARRASAPHAAPDLLAPEDGERRRHRRRRPAQIPRAQQRDLLGELRLQRIRLPARCRTPRAAAGAVASNAGEIAVVRRGDQRLEREVLLVLSTRIA